MPEPIPTSTDTAISVGILAVLAVVYVCRKQRIRRIAEYLGLAGGHR